MRAAIALAPTALCAIAPACATAVAQVSGEDRATTYTYLTALYAYDSAKVAAAPASQAAAEGASERLAAECPGVLAGAPGEEPPIPFEAQPSPQRPTPKQMGEENRKSRQRQALLAELHHGLGLAWLGPYRQAALAFIASVKPLHWSDSTLTALIHTAVADLEWELSSPSPDVCADIRTWVASGYKTLSPATKAFVGEVNVLVASTLRQLQHAQGAEGGAGSLRRYEEPGAKALTRKIKALQSQRSRDALRLLTIAEHTQSALGVAERNEAGQEAPEGPPKGSVKLGHRRTLDGGRYTAWLIPKRLHIQGGACTPSIYIETSVPRRVPGGSHFAFTSSDERCLSRSHRERPNVHCNTGTIVVEAQTGPRTRTVRLRLSNGRLATSRVMFVSTRRGGPVGFYYQALKGPSPIPLALTELDAHRRPLRTVKLHRQLGCTFPPVKLLPGGERTIARGQVPGGPSFSIVGKRFRYEGRVHFKLELEVEKEESGFFEGGSGIFFMASGSESLLSHRRDPFDSQFETGCHPHEYAIVYGILSAPHDTVLGRIDGVLQPFRETPVPSSLHVRGVLAYLASSTMPTELIVRNARGKTIFSESLADVAKALSEQCEGEAEG